MLDPHELTARSEKPSEKISGRRNRNDPLGKVYQRCTVEGTV